MAGRKSVADIHAAGGVVWRVHDGATQIALIHRPRYDDWSLPKGKLDDGETELAAAVREVHEEIGARVAVSRFAGKIHYQVGPARKQVSYWVMRHVGGEFVVNDEVDQLEWLPPKAARERMTHPVERTIVADFAAMPLPDSVVVLVRHAKAGKRSQWSGADELRPLDDVGLLQAQHLVPFLACFEVDQVVSAEPARCVQTVQPLADRLGLEVRLDPAFNDETFSAAPGRAETAVYALAKPGAVTVVASQGETIPGLVDSMVRGIRDSGTRKAAAWVLSFVDGTVVSADHYDPPSVPR